MPAYRLLDEVCSSRLYGFRPVPKGILHIGRDSLTEALAQEAAAGHSWHIEGLVQLAAAVAATEDDYSLVGLAARTRDAACIVVTRESMVLYAELGTLGMKLGEYEWAVTQEMQEQAARFVEEFRRILHCDLPAVKPENAACYYSAYEHNSVYGRCVRIGHNPYTTPPMYYYWRIDGTHGGNDQVSEFWSSEIWTTGRNVARHIADADPNAHESRI